MTVPLALVVGGTPVVRFALLAAVCGLLGALVMDVPMANQEHGFTPAYVAAGTLRRVGAEEVSFESAFVFHHVTGGVAGLLYAAAYLAFGLASAALAGPGVALGGVAAFPHVLATLLVSGFVYGFFAHLVLPRAGRRIYEERATAVRGQWLRSTVVFGIVLGVSVPAATTLL
ncbi:hypothetical protein [Halobellus rubicundus]|uniref:Uncharacterized protein n=1 Tax=Halobellus rubicundus TaxID=2996466 RepID=A0ABD5MCW9_9EURY